MAEDEDGISNKKCSQNSNNEGITEDNEDGKQKLDLGIEETKYNSTENGEESTKDAQSSSSKAGGSTRKEENPFSFRHFLKRDLSLPSSSTYESTGARPKVYANTVQHSPNKIDIHSETRREKARTDSQTKDKLIDGNSHQLSDNTTSNSSVEIPFSVVDNSESKNNLFIDINDIPFYHRPNLASEPLGMPSLPDFVQDHILVEQAYLNSVGPIDLDNLPDFTFNTNYNSGSCSSLGRRNSNRNYDYESYGGGSGTAAAGEVPLDLPPHISLDLTESLSNNRRNNSPHNTFPLDLPNNAGAESMRMPDFLPVHPGRTSPEPEHQDEQMQQIIAELERTRSELFTERSRRSRLESELESSREVAELLRAELASVRSVDTGRSSRDTRHRDVSCNTSSTSGESETERAQGDSTESEATIESLRKEIKRLKEQLSGRDSQLHSSVTSRAETVRGLRTAAARAADELRALASSIEQLRALGASLDPA